MCLKVEDIEELVSSHQPGWSMAQPFYVDPLIFELDMKYIFMSQWLFVGHISQVKQPGDYFTFVAGEESIIIVRAEDGSIHGHFNVCRHRGSQICLESSGHVRTLVCPYHQWVYQLDGALKTARLFEDNFDKSRFGLHSVHVRVLKGLIFICMADTPPPFDQIQSDFGPRLQQQRLERAKTAWSEHYTINANWKLFTENFVECYHCLAGHAEYSHIMNTPHEQETAEGAAQANTIRETRMKRWRQIGLECSPISCADDQVHGSSRIVLNEGFVSQSSDGQPVAPLMGSFSEGDVGALVLVIRPNFWFEAPGDYAWGIWMMPSGPTTTEVRAFWWVHPDAVEGVDYELQRLTAFWKVTMQQDIALCENNQAGVNSSRYQPGPHGPTETAIDWFTEWYLDKLQLG